MSPPKIFKLYKAIDITSNIKKTVVEIGLIHPLFIKLVVSI